MTRPLLLGHRGARSSMGIPENTLASFDLCVQQGCDGFEFDVRRTADNGAVVCHDETFHGLHLATASTRDLAHAQAEGFLPSLEQVLHRFAQSCFLDIELKDAGFESQVLDLLARHPPTRGYVVTSFHPAVLARLRELDAAVQLGFLFDRSSCGGGACSAKAPWRNLPVQWVLPEWPLLDDALTSNLMAAGKRVGAWTVNNPADMLDLAARGAEMLISDDTARLVNTFPVI